jgi:hypothetical protein
MINTMRLSRSPCLPSALAVLINLLTSETDRYSRERFSRLANFTGGPDTSSGFFLDFPENVTWRIIWQFSRRAQ